jgi:predicted nucleic acid-binding protein
VNLVVDASVAIKWFLPEIHSDAACRVLAGEHTLHAPDLIFAELGNVLWKRVRRNEMSTAEAGATIEALLSVPLHVQSSQSLILLAVEIAFAANRTVYDSLYVAAAIVHQFPLVTADAKLYRDLRKGPLAAHLLWIENIPAQAS